MKTYKELDAVLVGRNAKQKKLANNTYAIRDAIEPGTISIKLHGTYIVTFHAGGRIVLNSGGWKTVTTKARLNEFTPFGISQRNGIWYVSRQGDWENTVIFQDNMSFHNGRFHGFLKDDNKEQKLRKQIRDFSKLVVAKLPLPMPNGGDCWFCSMKTQEGKSLGDATKDKNHILSHIKEGYIVPSLVWNALESAGCNPQGQGSAWFGTAFGQSNLGKNQIGSFVKRYLYKQLGLAR